MICLKKLLYLKGFKANIIRDGAVLRVVLLIRMHVKQVHHLVSLNSAFEEEDEKSTRPGDLQVIGQQAGNGFVDQGLGDDIAGKARPQGISTKLYAELDTIFTQLVTYKQRLNITLIQTYTLKKTLQSVSPLAVWL